MSRRRFAAYFVVLSACSTAAFASHLFQYTASAESLEFAAYMAAPIPCGSFLTHGSSLPKSAPRRNAPRTDQVALVDALVN